MIDLNQGDLIKITPYHHLFYVASKNAYISATQMIHVCPVAQISSAGPLHIYVEGSTEKGYVICEQIRLIDPIARSCRRIDRLPYHYIMDISDALQGIFEYD